MALLYGLGFPPFRGGIFRWIETIIWRTLLLWQTSTLNLVQFIRSQTAFVKWPLLVNPISHKTRRKNYERSGRNRLCTYPYGSFKKRCFQKCACRRLSAALMTALLERNPGVNPAEIEDIIGAVLQPKNKASTLHVTRNYSQHAQLAR